MASVTVTLSSICAGGNHLTFTTTGAKEMTIRADRDTILTNGPVSDEDAAVFIRVLAKLAVPGRTLAQVRTLFQNGVTVTV